MQATPNATSTSSTASGGTAISRKRDSVTNTARRSRALSDVPSSTRCAIAAAKMCDMKMASTGPTMTPTTPPSVRSSQPS